MHKVTIKDIARKMDLSTATVSRALNNKSGIAKDKKIRIKEIAQQMGYYPNQNARNMRLGASKTIGVIISSLTDSFSTRVMAGIESEAHRFNLKVSFVSVDEDFKKEQECIHQFLENQIDGMIVAPSLTPYDYRNLIQDIPTVFIDRDPSFDDVQFNSVCLDNVDGARALIENMILKGARKIGLLNTSVSYSAELREKGYRLALENNGINYDSSFVVSSWNNKSNVDRMTRQLIRNQHCDSLFLADSSILVPALVKAQEYNIENLVVGVVDDCDWYDLLKIPVSSIQQPTYEIGIRSVSLLNGIINAEFSDIQQIRLKGKLISR